jgi:hypothetical protein
MPPRESGGGASGGFVNDAAEDRALGKYRARLGKRWSDTDPGQGVDHRRASSALRVT